MFPIAVVSIEDCAKLAARNFLPRCIALELQIFNDSVVI